MGDIATFRWIFHSPRNLGEKLGPSHHWMAPMGFGIGGVVYMNGTPKMRKKNRGTPKWMVDEGKPKITWMIWGSPILRNLWINWINWINGLPSVAVAQVELRFRLVCGFGSAFGYSLRRIFGVPKSSKVIQSHPKSKKSGFNREIQGEYTPNIPYF